MQFEKAMGLLMTRPRKGRFLIAGILLLSFAAAFGFGALLSADDGPIGVATVSGLAFFFAGMLMPKWQAPLGMRQAAAEMARHWGRELIGSFLIGAVVWVLAALLPLVLMTSAAGACAGMALRLLCGTPPEDGDGSIAGRGTDVTKQ